MKYCMKITSLLTFFILTILWGTNAIAGDCDYCVCDKGTVKPICQSCCSEDKKTGSSAPAKTTTRQITPRKEVKKNDTKAPQTIREITAKTLKCPEKQISVREIGVEKNRVRHEASGCGKTIQYLVPTTAQTARVCGECKCANSRCIRHCPDPNHPGGATYCCEYECLEWNCDC